MKQPKTIKFGKDILTVTKKTSLGSIEKLTGKMYVHPMFLKLDKKIMELVVMNMKFMRKFDGDLALSDEATLKKLKRLYPKIDVRWWIGRWGELLWKTAPTGITISRLERFIDYLNKRKPIDMPLSTFKKYKDAGAATNWSEAIALTPSINKRLKKGDFVIGGKFTPLPRVAVSLGRKPTKKEIAQWESESDAPSLDEKTVKELSKISKRISKSPKVNNGRNY